MKYLLHSEFYIGKLINILHEEQMIIPAWNKFQNGK